MPIAPLPLPVMTTKNVQTFALGQGGGGIESHWLRATYAKGMKSLPSSLRSLQLISLSKTFGFPGGASGEQPACQWRR